MKNEIHLLPTHCRQALSIIDQCTDDYMFIFDLEHDSFQISASALTVFALDDCVFDHAASTLKKFIYKDDFKYVTTEFIQILRNQQRSLDIECRCMQKDGKPIWVSTRGRVITDKNDHCRYLVGRMAQLDKQNKYDNVTGVYCENVLQYEYNLLNIGTSMKGFILGIGIDNFREVNEKYGVHIGDEVLKEVTKCIRNCVNDSKYIFRLKGDEFAILCTTQSDNRIEEARKLYKLIRSTIDTSIEQSGYHIFYTISAGAAEFDANQDEFDTLMRNVRFALHCAKIRGKNNFQGYKESEYQTYIRKLDIQEHLRNCIQNNFEGFEVYYQPIMKMETGNITGAEALIRWNSSKYGFMSPVEFVPLLEESSLIIPLGKWIIENAVAQCSLWMRKIPDFVMNINLSFVQLLKSDVLRDALECIDRYDLPHEHIVFEVTESGMIESSPAVKNVLTSFNAKSFILAIDDFGTGYSNLRYIKDLKFGIIKIDRLFVKNIQESYENFMLVKYITELAHNLHLKVCVEGVETLDELEKIQTLEPDCIQGFYFGKPMQQAKFAKAFV